MKKCANIGESCQRMIPAIYVAKTKGLISCVVTTQLICAFVFTYAKSRFSHDAARIFSAKPPTSTRSNGNANSSMGPGAAATANGGTVMIFDCRHSNSAGPDQTVPRGSSLIWVYNVCNSSCMFCWYFSIAKFFV